MDARRERTRGIATLPRRLRLVRSRALEALHEDSRLARAVVVRFYQLDMADAERLGELVERDDRRVAATSLEAAQILLAESRTRLDLLLRQALRPAQAGEIPAHQLAHIHAQGVARLHTIGL